VNEGVGHYYGVGAYLRPLEDARRAHVRFATECLGFANVPEPGTVELVVRPTESPPHHPLWKARVPRDRGAGWDFEDVRDHYVGLLFGVEPAALRYSDTERYLALSRVATGEVMARTIAEWRRPGSSCRGALVWMYRDLWPGAGWGIVDSTGLPKAAYWYMARACAAIATGVTDEGVNGIAIHAVNDSPMHLDAEVRVTLWRDKLAVTEGTAPVTLAPRAASTTGMDAILGRFTDAGYAYRFGPAAFDLVTVALHDSATGSSLSDVFHFPLGMPSMTRDIEMEAEVWRERDGAWTLRVSTDCLAIAVAVDVAGFTPSDSYFHVAPGRTKSVTLRGNGSVARPSGNVRALNASEPVRLVIRDDAPAARPASATGAAFRVR
jgi:beta-mannosidase